MAEPRSQSHDTIEQGRIIAVVVLGYVIVLLGLLASWQMQSTGAVVTVVFIGAAVTGVLCADFSRFRASGVGMSFEAKRPKRKVAKRSQRPNVQSDDLAE